MVNKFFLKGKKNRKKRSKNQKNLNKFKKFENLFLFVRLGTKIAIN